MTDSTLIVHTDSHTQRATLVRLTHDIRGDEQRWRSRQREFASLREERAEVERVLADATDLPSDVNQLRERLEYYNDSLDGMDEAVYVTCESGSLHLENRFRRRTLDLFPSETGVRAEWHGETVDANSVTLLLGLAPVRTDGPAPAPAGWRSGFDAVYRLDEGELLRWVRTPFIAERRNYTQELPYYSGTDNPPSPLCLSFRWDGELHPWTVAMHECGLGSVLRELGVEPYEWAGPKELLQLRLGGDWIVRTDAPLEEKLRAFERILERELGRHIRFTRQSVAREAIIVTGDYARQYLKGHENTNVIYLFTGRTPGRMVGGGNGSVVKMLESVGNRFNLPVIFESQNLNDISVSYFDCDSFTQYFVRKPGSKEAVPMPGEEEKLESVLANLTRQTSLEFARETRPFDTWFVSEISDPNTMTLDKSPLE